MHSSEVAAVTAEATYCTMKLEKMPLIDNQGQINRTTTLSIPHTLDSAAVTGLAAS